MSDLTDQLDTALATLSDASAGYEAIIQANQATIAALQSALDAAQAGEAADEAELQKALDTVTAVNEKLTITGGAPSSGTPTSDGSSAGPSDPASDPAAAGGPSAPVTVVEEPTPADQSTSVGADGAPTPVETGAEDSWSDSGVQPTQ